MDQSADSFLKFQTRKDITYLYKGFLTLLEDIREDHFFMLEKLEKELPSEYHDIVRSSNYMDENKFALFRKRVLDAGNNAIRQSEEQIGKFQIDFQ